ncbi:MAG: efflux RND transporter periplasmic adaptor subunit [Planctomycetes bacterium]|nr:efflux RND transporter periplasmic adaptor subunit [Planctomycetota bacterium]
MYLSLPKTCLLLLILAACSRPASVEEPASESENTSATTTTDEKKPSAKAKLVRAVVVETDTATNILEVTANVESLDMVDIMPEKAEPVVKILVEEGDTVVAGQVLAKLRDSQSQLAVDEAIVKVSEAEISLKQASREYDRDQRLIGDSKTASVLSQRDLETRLQTLDTAKTTLQAAQLSLKTAHLGLSQCNIVSPIDGTITIRDISIGDMASVGTRVFQVIDLSSPRVIMNRPQRELSSLKVGQELTATSDALPGVIISGRIERISPAVNLDTGTIKVTAQLESTVRLPNGILVRVDLVLDSHNDVAMLDKRALVNEGDNSYAFVIRDNHAFKVEVFKGFDSELRVEIAKGTEIFKGDQVVVVGADRLKDGDLIKIVSE